VSYDVERYKKWKAEWSKEYRRKNKEKIQAYAKDYNKKYLAEHRDEIRAANTRRAAEKRALGIYLKSGGRRPPPPERKAAKKAVQYAVTTGKLVRPKECSECGGPGPIDAHHEDYSPDKKLDIIWLCHCCHMRRHRQYP
jgi:hypothetical protein